MRLAIVSLMGGLPWGGSEALWHSLAAISLENKDQIFISVYDWGTLHEKIRLLQSNGAVINTRKQYNPNAPLTERIIRFIRKRKPSLNSEYQSVVNFKPDAVFISQGDSFDLAIHHRPLYDLLRFHKIPYSFICHSHAQYSFIPPAEIYPGAIGIFKDAKQVFFVSQRQWKLTERRLAMQITNGHLTWNPLNTQVPLAPLEWKQNETAQMAIVGNMSGGKGHDTALEVLSAPQWKERKWKLNIYGEGEGKKYLQELAKFYGITKNIVFHGHVTDLQKVWEQNHLLLIPSAGEGLPISLVEAMACGRPAVVTDVGGNIELIAEHETGFIAISPTTEAFAASMEKAWGKKDSWMQFGINAFNKINAVLEKEPGKKIYELLKYGK